MQVAQALQIFHFLAVGALPLIMRCDIKVEKFVFDLFWSFSDWMLFPTIVYVTEVEKSLNFCQTNCKFLNSSFCNGEEKLAIP